jgi:SAM-dependent methyltransferase
MTRVPKQAEVDYASRIGDQARRHATDKPFSDPGRAKLLQQIGIVVGLLPPPPARVLDMGCGTGWTTEFLHRSGYDVVGLDIAPDMIDLARTVPARRDIEFVVADYEGVPTLGTFDAVVFFDSLHHAEDERAALQAAFDALGPAGVVVLSEPGLGHHLTQESMRAKDEFGVTEKEMPPSHIVAMAHDIGFADWDSSPYPFEIMDLLATARGPAPEPTPSTFRSRAKDAVRRVVAAPVVRLLGGPSPGSYSTSTEFTFLRALRLLYCDFPSSGRGGFTVLRKGHPAPRSPR